MALTLKRSLWCEKEWRGYVNLISSSSFTQVRINEKDEETVTLDGPITNETKEVPIVIIN